MVAPIAPIFAYCLFPIALKKMSRFLNNWTLKIMSLVLAIALWSHVRGEVNPLETATFTAKIDARAPRGWSFGGAAIPKTARVTLRAPRSRLRELKGGLPANPLAPPDTAPLLSTLQARLEVPILKTGATTATVRVDSQIEDAEIIGVKPADIVVSLAKTEK